MQFSERAKAARPSPIREAMKYSLADGVISFAGGLPAPDLFPVDALREIMPRILAEEGKVALQYGATDGHLPLREQFCIRMAKAGIKNADPAKVLVLNGSQQALYFAAKVFVNEGDVILTERPSYPGAINAFRWSMPHYVDVATDKQGMVPEDLEATLKKYQETKLIYVIPNFQNPTGITMGVERRKSLADIASRYGVPLLEDNPYGELSYDYDEQLPSIKSFDTEGCVIYIGSTSKIFCPGFRVGWAYIDNPDIYQKFIFCKQGSDLHTSEFSQRVIACYLREYDIDAHVLKLRDLYRHRRDVMLAAINAKFPKGVRYMKTGGGLFQWLTLPEGIDTGALLAKAVEKKVVYLHGEAFYVRDPLKNRMRLNFSNMDDERITEGIGRLAALLSDVL
ncbi:MAG: PLP-dependent aminotransferase family protein [Desulfovibrio sp.]|nr:PLP-dependent aminotransferase family protein [Desulfovibrio sp.]